MFSIFSHPDRSSLSTFQLLNDLFKSLAPEEDSLGQRAAARGGGNVSCSLPLNIPLSLITRKKGWASSSYSAWPPPLFQSAAASWEEGLPFPQKDALSPISSDVWVWAWLQQVLVQQQPEQQWCRLLRATALLSPFCTSLSTFRRMTRL